MKGVFNLQPPMPKYKVTWDVDIVLDYLCMLPSNGDFNLQQLSHKLVMLMTLTNAGRCSDLATLNLSFCSISGNSSRFVIPGLTRSCRSGPPLEATYPAFTENPQLCPVQTLKAYMLRTQPLRQSANPLRERELLFISVRKPHNPVGPATLGRWLRGIMHQSSIDTNVFSAHLTRGAANSKARIVGVSLENIIKAANWSNTSAFSRFYHRPLITSQFGRSILMPRGQTGEL